MQQCCNDCYKLCLPFPSCPEAMFIFVPIDYTEADILVQIVKPGVNVSIQQLLTIVGGSVELDFTGLPEGFFNPYGGSYELSMYYPVTNQPVLFTAPDGKVYDTICFSFITTYQPVQTDIIINPYESNP